MTYQEKVSFDGIQWYQIEWEGVDFSQFNHIDGIKDCKNIEELEERLTTSFPNSNFKSTFIGKRK